MTKSRDYGLGKAVEDSIADMKHHSTYISIAAHYVRNRTDAEDVVQEAYTRALRSKGRFQGDSEVSTWVTRIVINLAIDHVRNQQTRRRYGHTALDEGSPAAVDFDRIPDECRSFEESYLDRDVLAHAYERLIAEDPRSGQTVDALIRQHIGGEKTKDIAEDMGLPEGTLGFRRVGVRSRFREIIAGYEAEVERPYQKAA